MTTFRVSRKLGRFLKKHRGEPAFVRIVAPDGTLMYSEELVLDTGRKAKKKKTPPA